MLTLDRLGVIHPVTRLKLRAASDNKEEKLIAHLKNNLLVTYLAKLDGNFDIAFSLRCLQSKQAIEFNDDLIEKYHDVIMERTTALYIEAEFFSREYLINKKYRKLLKIKSHDNYKKLDQIDILILECLTNNARSSYVEIAKHINAGLTNGSFTKEAVSNRIRKLEQQGWISNYWLVLSPNHGDFLYAKVEIRLEQISSQKKDEFLKFCRTNPRIISLLRLIGSWDYELDIELENYRQGKELMMELTKAIPNIIKDYNLTIVTSIEKWDQSGIFKIMKENIT